ncbi:MAG: RAMP superfamily CRISPR-associated protein [Acidobacteriota bacterium]
MKSENSINRIQGVALNPRFTERATPDSEFDFSISLKRFEGDGDSLEELLLQGLGLLQLDALGGSGSRGYGRIAVTFNDSSIQKRFEAISQQAGRPEA